ncbi:MAG TPA: hypothetical protein VGX68_21280 [Thermoanaerobaculia bacterium]|jgi:hypothetical protein|nr:hypothetical protein [Thermoanaerobaculia bacterium]
MPKRPTPQSPITFWLGVAFLMIGVSLAYLLVAFWPRTLETPPAAGTAPVVGAPASPAVGGSQTKPTVWAKKTHVLWADFDLDADVRLLILVLFSGALGSYIHAVQSFASYVGNARFKTTWTWWYILRLPMGAALALFVYFVVRGGLLAAGTATASSAANDLNLFGIMSFSGLAGLFSKQAADKLAEVFDTLFATKEGHQREDKLTENARPELTSIDPNPLPAPSGAAKIVLSGEGFIKDSMVKAAGRELRTTHVSPQSLSAQIDAADFPGQTEIAITVFNPPPGGGESDPVTLKIKKEESGDLATVTPISG